MTEPPLACTLDAGQMSARLIAFDELAQDALLEQHDLPEGVRLRLRNSPAIERRTRELVAAEARCCAFLDFRLRVDDDALELEITGPEHARTIIDQLLAAKEPR
jgi:MerR family transcriptional regulator, copper efflux regulator